MMYGQVGVDLPPVGLRIEQSAARVRVGGAEIEPGAVIVQRPGRGVLEDQRKKDRLHPGRAAFVGGRDDDIPRAPDEPVPACAVEMVVAQDAGRGVGHEVAISRACPCKGMWFQRRGGVCRIHQEVIGRMRGYRKSGYAFRTMGEKHASSTASV